MDQRHVTCAWVVTCEGRPDWDIRRAYSIEECWWLAMQKFNAKTRAQLRRRGIGITPVRIVETVVSFS